jgi:F-box/leucine-rich repeat protein 2/20
MKRRHNEVCVIEGSVKDSNQQDHCKHSVPLPPPYSINNVPKVLRLPMTTYLFNLPAKILENALFPFLSLSDIVKLDIAVTNTDLRCQLFDIYPNVTINPTKGGICGQQWDWFHCRSICMEILNFKSNLTVVEVAEIFDKVLHDRRMVRHVKHLHCPPNTDLTHFAEALTCFSGLETLDLSGCLNVSTNLLDQFAQRCPNLRVLDLSDTNVKAEAVISLSEQCQTLTHVSLRECCMQDDAIASLAKNCLCLQELDLRGCYPEVEVLVDLAIDCPTLTSLSVGGYHVTDACMLAFAHNLRGLTYLDLTYSDSITDEAMIAVAQNCTLLSLNLSYCDQLTDEAVVAVARGCNGLTELVLNRCNHITDKAIIAVARNCPTLKVLDIRWCRSITQASIVELSRHCPYLSFLDIGGCDMICSKKTIQILSRGCCDQVTVTVENQPVLDYLID